MDNFHEKLSQKKSRMSLSLDGRKAISLYEMLFKDAQGDVTGDKKAAQISDRIIPAQIHLVCLKYFFWEPLLKFYVF